jgi:hypothetical protein
MPTQDLPDCQSPPACDARPTCPVCGGLECLCRPRFFAGQLLTEDDLNRLERYIVDKNKLHNRYLHGWGVACGLEVKTSVCDSGGSGGKVIVEPGYALSPCGNDIIVCRQEAVDICELINRCRPPAPDECHAPGGNDAYVDGREEWILAICYAERPSRGITALRGASAPQCACGKGNCGGGCGCQGGKQAYAPEPASPPKPVAAQCEPTLVCEGYTFRAFKAPKKNGLRKDYGALPTRMLCCLLPLVEQLGAFPARDTHTEQLQQWHLAFRNAVKDFLVAECLFDHLVAQQLLSIPIPQVNANPADDYSRKFQESTLAVVGLASNVIQKCVCSALLPPCPEPGVADCVPLASVTIGRALCRVNSICNLSARKFLITAPAISYWLSWIPLFQSSSASSDSLSAILARMCCTPVANQINDIKDTVVLTSHPGNAPVGQARRATATAPGRGQGSSPGQGTVFGGMLGDALGSTRSVNAATLLLAAMGATDQQDQALLSDRELAQPAALLLLNQVLAPALRTLLAAPAGAPLATGSGDAAALRDQLSALARTVDTLQSKLETQQKTIDQLTKPKLGRPIGGAHGPK